ncbi:RarD protein, DMT superfamily transporter [Gordonia bronchialis DSM 43247]|uniref:RarD protein, DMT superfamily transporter n=1 Tax=Gordonia bronchialis (strain ATCC 25592 / DSM 43247 / BCRC 13721 / JCM 3198 / KCTC 3076 / NBRC 16047 / NCTC 10667) TaxID=526226 RepID=D0LE19_GORB4|nr:EamA family transporter RarD [Gordonia bronchialis]ACY22611.1 RarD protein, DMT superfamily transporter [Gordonia bronchialis DSM 43247]MCC3325393.1 EamA family transporter RarD [Gordonia bronchialis]QGS23912.1 EamA family transporter RarD [Gordonia bronchialis]UAK39918.1 EamA family transporter RarD [Gordonia bronchialis]STQ65551.1 putative chloramphenical resistance permease RarD [Gordonia bronchialis]
MTADSHPQATTGTLCGVGAYSVWGLFPLYFHLLIPASAWEILGNRIVWTMLCCVVVLAALRQFGFVRGLLADRRRLAMTAAAGVAIAANWVIYVQAVVTGHVTQASLGYFLNPLFTVALGVLVLRERLRPLQVAAVVVGLVACIYLAVDDGHVPWIALSLAFSFGLYGLIKNRVGGHLTALQGLTTETVLLTPPAAIMLIVLAVRDESTFTTEGWGHTLLLMSTGVATAIPLLLFAAAASRIPLVSVGLLQFITPVLQLICGVAILGEHLSPGRWVGFGIVWLALALLSIDAVREATQTRRLTRRRIDGTAI